MSRLPDPARRQLWQERMDRFALSGLTVIQFCQQEGVSAPSFYQWKKKLAMAEAKPAPRFVPVKVEPPRSIATVRLPGGATLEIEPQFGRQGFTDVFAAIIEATKNQELTP